ncbi:MAG: SDR family oxidoreductase [Candidatus Abyssubacteria bacterium]
MNAFANKIAIVTGGASGIGRAVASELVGSGATVVLADMNAALLSETTASLAGNGARVKAVPLDVTDFGAVKDLIDRVFGEFGRLDYLFNNAGIAVLGDARDFSYEDWRSVVDTNLYGVINGVAAAYPRMVEQGFGHIVNTASLAGLIPSVGEISYSASKFGVVGLSHSLRVEGADLGVKISVVCPGFIRTEIVQNAKLLGIDRAKMMDSAPKMMSVEQCARIILRGVERNKSTIVITQLAWVTWLLYRIHPDLMIWVGKRFMRKMRQLLTER